MITRESDYAIRTVLYLAQHQGEGTVPSAALAESMAIPYRFLRKIIQKLVEAGIVDSRKGKNGGVALLKKKREISLLDVLKALDAKSLTINNCFKEEATCPRSENCAVHQALDGIQHNLHQQLAAVTFDQLCNS